jgi:glycosyltransferase involved in cell wall biosynthesis
VEWHLIRDRAEKPKAQGLRLRAWEQWSLPRAAREIDADLLHAPDGSVPWWQPVPTVVTIHDTSPWRQREATASPDLYHDRLLPAAYHRAAAIITISQTVRRDILARWPALRDRLHVVSPGVAEQYLEAVPNRRPIVIGGCQVVEPFLLYIGGADPRRRLMWALQAWWAGAGLRSMLVVCGVEEHLHAQWRQTVPRDLRSKVVFAPFIDEADMPRLYMRAEAVLYPALTEGFGLPVIEAQAVGTRVLFSAVGSLSELQGPGAIVLPVDDLPAWVRAIDLLVQSRSATHGPDRIARAWARQYSWDTYVERTLAIYDSVRHIPSLGTVSQTSSS